MKYLLRALLVTFVSTAVSNGPAIARATDRYIPFEGNRREGVVVDLGYTDRVPPGEALSRTVAWERANPAGQALGFGMVDHEAEDAIRARLRG